ncbi:hypothetical protein ACIA9I_34625 [Streptomyces anulatus]
MVLARGSEVRPDARDGPPRTGRGDAKAGTAGHPAGHATVDRSAVGYSGVGST